MVNAIELWRTSEQAIVNYTGLSPATFFTILAVSLTLYYVVSGWFRSPPPTTREVVEEVMEPLPPPVELGEITAEELSAYDGSDPKKPLLMAIKGQIYDVTQSRMFYGPGGPYALFTGKDASRALAKMSFEKEDLTGDISGLGPFELEALQDWEYKFMSKYVKVGTVKKTVPVTDGSTSETTEASTVTTEDSPTERPGEHTVESKVDREVHVPEPKEVKTEMVDEAGEHTVESKDGREVHVPEPKEVKTEKVDEVEDAKE